jgi:hypothetical protein
MAGAQANSSGDNRKGRPTPSPESGELSEQALDLVTGGVGPQLAVQNWTAFLQLTGSSG